ncbi:MAG: hypothetical protein V4723_16270 [Pseudomonadota bacterium]
MIANTSWWRFTALVLALLAAMMALNKPIASGDIHEYALTMIALDRHGTPDLTAEDIAIGRVMVPSSKPQFDLLDQQLAEPGRKVLFAYARGRDDKLYAIHFFGYPLMAVLPYKLTQIAVRSPLRAFQVVNAAFILILALSLFRLYRSAWKAMLVLGLFLLSGGILYFSWTSPEIVSAAGLLAGLVLFCSGAPLRGALLAGIAAQQNPTILAFFGFAPMMLLCLQYQHGTPLRQAALALLTRKNLVALVAGLAVFALPIIFNLLQFGVPNIIAQHFSDSANISLIRLISFYFDLNQGMIVGIPGVLLMLCVWGWRGERRQWHLLGLGLLFTLALALPALSVYNWNSGASGPMRYAFWASMPLLFVLAWRLHTQAKWPPLLLAAVLALQGLAMLSATGNMYLSPLARLVLEHAPRWYHPEPEIFVERTAHHDSYYWPHEVYVHRVGQQAVTTLYNANYPGADERLCGPGKGVAADNDMADSDRGWRYVHGTVRCQPIGNTRITVRGAQLGTGDPVKLDSGWYGIEDGGGDWSGAWSSGKRSRIEVKLPPGLTPTAINVNGNYFGDNTHTRVFVNGKFQGRLRLNEYRRITFSPSIVGAGPLVIELVHEAPRVPEAAGDPRTMSFFLRSVMVHSPAG